MLMLVFVLAVVAPISFWIWVLLRRTHPRPFVVAIATMLTYLPALIMWNSTGSEPQLPTLVICMLVVAAGALGFILGLAARKGSTTGD